MPQPMDSLNNLIVLLLAINMNQLEVKKLTSREIAKLLHLLPQLSSSEASFLFPMPQLPQ